MIAWGIMNLFHTDKMRSYYEKMFTRKSGGATPEDKIMGIKSAGFMGIFMGTFILLAYCVEALKVHLPLAK
jgi:hypothetical protein